MFIVAASLCSTQFPYIFNQSPLQMTLSPLLVSLCILALSISVQLSVYAVHVRVLKTLCNQ